jgi:hypothetical protein
VEENGLRKEETLSETSAMASEVGRTMVGGVVDVGSRGWSSPLLVPRAGERAIAVKGMGKIAHSWMFVFV